VVKGFSLVELMVVVAIITVLALISYPSYQEYTVRAKTTEVEQLVGAITEDMANYYNATGRWPSASQLKYVTTAGDELAIASDNPILNSTALLDLTIAPENPGRIEVNLDHTKLNLDAPVAGCASNVTWRVLMNESNDRLEPSCCYPPCATDFLSFIPNECRISC